MAAIVSSEAVFDLFSYARRGPGRRDRLSPSEVQQITRIVRRIPEVMVKVLSQGANDPGAVRRHVDYIGRKGEVELETDDGDGLRGPQVGKELPEDWDLDVEDPRRKADLSATRGKPGARLVHKLVFSMPAGTPSEKVLIATRNFMREEFGLQHRYVMALHTDEPHPHVHVVLKAVSEQGKRLNIRKATLREWREGFARHLRAVGIEANATSGQLRGAVTPRKTDGIYRASLRGESTHMRERALAAARALAAGRAHAEPGQVQLIDTRRVVQRAWNVVGNLLTLQGRADLSEEVRKFTALMPPPMTERGRLAAQLMERARDLPVH